MLSSNKNLLTQNIKMIKQEKIEAAQKRIKELEILIQYWNRSNGKEEKQIPKT